MIDNPILVFGANGQVGSALVQLLGNNAIGLTSLEANFKEATSLPAIIEHHNPSAIINAAAYTAVDQAEEEFETARIINAIAPGHIAETAKSLDIPLIHYSTDYVFDGRGTAAWKPDDKTAPLNAYGTSKYEGEQAILKTGCKALIFRTSWVYDTSGKNFLNTMLRLGKERETLTIVADQFGAPTYAPDLAKTTITALNNAQADNPFPTNIYHLCGQGETNWFEFASTIFEYAKQKHLPLKVQDIKAITSEEFPTPAKRPHNSRMDCSQTSKILGATMPDWKDSLKEAFTLIHQ